MSEQVVCKKHGKMDYALVCCHLRDQTDDANPIEYYRATDESTSETSDVENVWCKACDDVLLHEGEWNDTSESFADVQVVCVSCLAAIKLRNIGINL
jgi:hypothetical protein